MRESTKIIKALAKEDCDSLLVKGELGSGLTNCKLKEGTTAGIAQNTIYYLLHDIAIDLAINFDAHQLRHELMA